MKTIAPIDDLPTLYRALFPDIFSQEVPKETLATCNDCAMLPNTASPYLDKNDFFNPKSKCCTYQPTLPNYLIGGLLKDKTPGLDEGRARILEKIKRGHAVTPLGIKPGRKYDLLYKHGSAKGFGKALSLRCPYYLEEKGQCGIWKFRESVCSTYYCKQASGTDGQAFWMSLKYYLGHVEYTLSHYVITQMPGTPYPDRGREQTNIGPDDMDERKNPKTYTEAWGEWEGKEVEFYIKAFECIEALDKQQFEQILGSQHHFLSQKLAMKREKIVNVTLPTHLIRSIDLGAMPSGDEHMLLKTKEGTIRVRKPIYDILNFFNGERTVAQALETIATELGYEIDRQLLIMLYQYRVLVPAKQTRLV